MVKAAPLGPDTSVTPQGCRETPMSRGGKGRLGEEISKCYEFNLEKNILHTVKILLSSYFLPIGAPPRDQCQSLGKQHT